MAFDLASAKPVGGFDLATAQPVTAAAAPARPSGMDNFPLVQALNSLASKMVAPAFGGYAGAGSALLGQGAEKAAKTVGDVTNALTYEPGSEAGKDYVKAAEYLPQKLLGWVPKVANVAGEKVAEVTHSPAVGAAVNTAIQALPAVLLHKALKPTAEQITAAETAHAAQAVDHAQLASEAAQHYAGANGLDWNALSSSVQDKLTTVAADAMRLDKLDPNSVARQARLESLPVPVPATAGQLARDPVALRNEGNVSTTAAGAPIRDIHLAQNQALLDNLDVLKGNVSGNGATAATARSPQQVGEAVQGAARAKEALSKKNYNDLYATARATEPTAKVSAQPLFDLLQDNPEIQHIGFVKTWLDKAGVRQNPPEKPASLIIDPATQKAFDQASTATASTTPKITLPKNFDDSRLGSGLYRNGLKSLSEELVPRGGIAYLKDINDNITGRSSSLNPDWFQGFAQEHGVTVKGVQATVQKALDGGTLGAKEQRLIKQMMDEVADREGVMGPEFRNRTNAEVDAQARLSDLSQNYDHHLDFGPRTEPLPSSLAALSNPQKSARINQPASTPEPTRGLTLNELHDLRQKASDISSVGGTTGFYAGHVVRAIDNAFEQVPAAAGAWRTAIDAFKNHQREFNDQRMVRALVNDKSPTDRQTALEDTAALFKNGSVEDIEKVKNSLLTGGDSSTRAMGEKALNEVRAHIIQTIKDDASHGVALNVDGSPNITQAAFRRAVEQYDPAQLDAIFGEKTAKQLNDILSASREVKTIPPSKEVGSSTVANALALLGGKLSSIPGIGPVGRGVVKLHELGKGARVAAEAVKTPLNEAAIKSIKVSPYDANYPEIPAMLSSLFKRQNKGP